MDRAEFMQACARGRRALHDAASRLAREFWQPLCNEVAFGVGPDTAADLAQQTLIKAWQRCAQYKGDAPLGQWLKAIVRRLAIDHLRARRVHLPLLGDDGEPLHEAERALFDAAAQDIDPAAIAETAQTRRIFDECFARLARDHPEAAMVMRWVAIDGADTAEVAALLGKKSAGATRQAVSTCRKLARAYLAPWYAALRAEQPA